MPRLGRRLFAQARELHEERLLPREISAALFGRGFTTETGRSFSPQAIKNMLDGQMIALAVIALLVIAGFLAIIREEGEFPDSNH